MRKMILAALLFVTTTAGLAQDSATEIEAGRAAWNRRAEDSTGPVAAGEPIAEAIVAFEAALAADPADLGARAWLLKALWFQGEHLDLDVDEKLPIFERGRDLAQEAIETLAAGVDADPRSPTPEAVERLRQREHAAEIYFWGAAHWGLWGRYRGKIASARQGVAAKIRDYAEITITLDDRIEAGGGYRILGRLHTEAPKLPFVTGWIDRGEAIRQLERAVAIAPHDMMNRLYLLEALIEFDPKQKQTATSRLQEFVELEPRPATRVEDLKILAEARTLLDRVE